MNKRRLSDILELCLEQVLSGQDTVDSVLARYPDYADELRAELDAALWLQDRRGLMEMRPGYLVASRTRLVAQISQPVPVKKPILAWWRRPAFRLSIVALFLFVSIFSVWGGVQAVGASLPGDMLYQYKLTVEDFRLSLVSDPAERAALHIQFAEARAREIETLLALGRYEDLDQAFEDYRGNLAIAADLIPNLDTAPEQKVALLQELEHKAAEHNQTFSAAATGAAASVLPTDILDIILSTVVSNDEIRFSMTVFLNALGAEPVPLSPVTSTPTGAPSRTSSPGETPEPDYLADPDDPDPADAPDDPGPKDAPDDPGPKNAPDDPDPTDEPDDPDPTDVPDDPDPTDVPDDPTDVPDDPDPTDVPDDPDPTDVPDDPDPTDVPDDPDKDDKDKDKDKDDPADKDKGIGNDKKIQP